MSCQLSGRNCNAQQDAGITCAHVPARWLRALEYRLFTRYRQDERGRAVALVERGYEDYGDRHAQSVLVIDKAIILADGNITTSSTASTALLVYGAAVVEGSVRSKPVSAGQHIYLDSLQSALVLKKSLRDNRYAVCIRQEPGISARRVFFRTQASAQRFADALETLRFESGMR